MRVVRRRIVRSQLLTATVALVFGFNLATGVALADGPSLQTQRSIELVSIPMTPTQMPSDKPSWQQTEWWDSWTTNYMNKYPAWYTPRHTQSRCQDMRRCHCRKTRRLQGNLFHIHYN